MIDTKKLTVSSSPQIHSADSTAKIMWTVVLSLVPAGIWGVYIFGMSALVVILVSIIAAVAAEALLGLINREVTVNDGSAFLTGLLVGYNMPPQVPLFIPVVASVFAIVVVKWSFGGLGANWMNPALAGRVFVFFSWTGPMTKWLLPITGGADAVTGPTPLGSLKSAYFATSLNVSGPIEYLQSEGLPVTYKDLFIGNIPGSIGEVSALLLLLGALVLLARKILTWHVPVAYIGSFAFLIWMFGGVRMGTGLFTGDVLFHILSGGLMLGALYMATDMATTPLTGKGNIIFGLGCGFLSFLIRIFGSLPEAVSLSIIVMNIFVPVIDRYTKIKRFGYGEVKEKSGE
ncbi:RnfABCDGE type electron transport complex subunit D [Spirochaeta isovalerica]|uniref:Ion-translocating oxidoreductase complex subunit D n=1 Tax=Spirochaeta isovalerica TaxID=150 RepID=A0A841RBF1_9SPIO|nr:RnfABCDGE type electron transport complex subunit D [Spirochaeta isovalerica]MBB6480239.1 electron transport complex protein RnfD [Spirochaeta isovalerica]